MALVQFPKILAPIRRLMSVVFNMSTFPLSICSSEFPPESSVSLRGLATKKVNSRSCHFHVVPLSDFGGV